MKFFETIFQRCGMGNEQLEQSATLSHSDIRRFFAIHRISEVLPYESYDAVSQLFFNKSSTGFIMEFPPLVGCSAETEKELSGLFQHTLPVGSSMQFLLWADHKIDPILSYWSRQRKEKSIFEKLATKRVDFLKETCEAFEGSQNFRNFRCIVSVSINGKKSNPVEIQELVYLREQVMTTFKTLGLSVQLWAPESLIQFVNDTLCFTPSVEPQKMEWNPYDLIAQQVATSASILQIDEQSLLFDE